MTTAGARGVIMLIMAVVESPRSLHRDARSCRPSSTQIVSACMRYARSVRYQGVTIQDLCAVSGAPERRVRDAFYDCYGVSPTAHLRAAALREVRRALLEGPPARDAVSRAATDFGFWHLSRFAGQYRDLFGEPPSATVARRAHTR